MQATPKNWQGENRMDTYVVRIDEATHILLNELLEREEKRLTVNARDMSWDEQDRAIAALVQVKLTIRAVNGQ
jgi:hypothetical protein